MKSLRKGMCLAKSATLDIHNKVVYNYCVR
nr:MAG TPA: hypothetical protein [Caudoviricetes sp.]